MGEGARLRYPSESNHLRLPTAQHPKDRPLPIPHIAIIGAGPAGLMAALVAARGGARVEIFERMPSPARKFLMAGRGGLNLTHGEALDIFVSRYGAARDWLAPLIEHFSPDALRQFAHDLGEETFVGSSGRVFPKSFKASPLLRAWLRELQRLQVQLHLRHEFRGFADDGALRIVSPAGEKRIKTDATILALGGASWPRLGATGDWVEPLTRDGFAIAPLRPANCGFEIAWSDVMKRHAGAPLKAIIASAGNQSRRGECIVTERGLEGGVIYALSATLRDEIEQAGHATLTLDLRPDVSREDLAAKLARPRGRQTVSSVLRKSGGLSPVAAALLREVGALPQEPVALATQIKALPLRLTATAGLARAISTAGGVKREALDAQLMARHHAGVFLAGEMLDWEAPTGGYLLQACFATGLAAGEAALAYAQSHCPP